jgi:hypothetical protein
MNSITSQIYRICVPKFIRKKILARNLPIAIQKYYSDLPEKLSPEIESVLNYLKNKPMTVLPYDFQDKYIAENIEVFKDEVKGLPYVLLNGKRLYFKKRWGNRKIRTLYNTLLKEQDLQSPHRYLSEQFRFEEGDVLVDAGVAEGNFALSIVEIASRIVLFEADKEWIEPLNATFEPWKDKVVIVNKYISDVTNATNITLDDYFTSEEKVSFLKIDVEGAESRLLKGSHRILSESKSLRLAICTYHKQEDEKEFKEILSKYGYTTSHSNGYMLYYYDKKLKAPYLRRGLIRAEKLSK